MAPSITRKPYDMDLNTKCRKQKERSRSRQNREQFRQLIGELSINVTGSKLSTNKCLMAVSKTFKLSNVSKWLKEDLTLIDGQTMHFASITNLLAIEGHLGWAFDNDGYILYVSPNFQKRLNIQGCVIGTHLSKLMPEYDYVLRSLFIDNCQSTCTTIKKKSSKLAFRPSPTPAYMYGKVLTTNQGEKVYVGSVLFYSDKSSFHHQNFQYSNANFAEIVLDENFEFVKRHKLLEKMQNFNPPIGNFLDSIHPSDLQRLITAFGGAKKQFNIAFRVKKCESLDSIMVYAQFYLGNTQNGNNVISAFLSPAILDKLDENELHIANEEKIVVKEEKIELTPHATLSPAPQALLTTQESSSSSSSTSDSFCDEINYYGSYESFLPENDKDILHALDEMFPCMLDTDDEFKDMPHLELPSYIKCFDS